jgi:hypothetical protein
LIIPVTKEFDDGRWEYEVILETSKGTFEVEIDGESGMIKEVERKGGKGCKGAGILIIGLSLAMIVVTFISLIL